MFTMNRRFRLLDEAVDGADGGGGGDNGEAATKAAAEAAALASAKLAAEAAAAKASEDAKGTGMTEKERELLKESMGRKEKIKDLESRLTTSADALKAWEGLDPADVRKLVQERKAAEQQQLEDKGEFTKLRQQILEAHAGETKTLNEQIAALNSKVSENLSHIDALTIGQAFSASKFIADELVLTPSKARTIYGAHFERDAEGTVVAYTRPAGNKDRAPLVDGQGNPLSFDQALLKIVDADPDRDALKKAKTKAGADSGSSGSKKTEDHGDIGAGVSRIAAALNAGGLKKASRG